MVSDLESKRQKKGKMVGKGRNFEKEVGSKGMVLKHKSDGEITVWVKLSV